MDKADEYRRLTQREADLIRAAEYTIIKFLTERGIRITTDSLNGFLSGVDLTEDMTRKGGLDISRVNLKIVQEAATNIGFKLLNGKTTEASLIADADAFYKQIEARDKSK